MNTHNSVASAEYDTHPQKCDSCGKRIKSGDALPHATMYERIRRCPTCGHERATQFSIHVTVHEACPLPAKWDTSPPVSRGPRGG